MSISIQIKDALFSKTIAGLYPFYADLAAFFLFGGTLADSQLNRATGELATVIGEPTINAASAVTNAQNGFRTNLAVSGPVTYIAIATPVNSAVYCGNINYNAPRDAGEGGGAQDSIGMTGNQFFVQANAKIGSVEGDAGVKFLPISAAGNRFMAGTVSPEASTGYYYNNGVAQIVSGLGIALNSDNPFFRIGGHSTVDNTFPADVTIAAVMYYGRVLSAEEIQSVHDYLVPIVAGRGVVVS